jgi:hypothetical protein
MRVFSQGYPTKISFPYNICKSQKCEYFTSQFPFPFYAIIYYFIPSLGTFVALLLIMTTIATFLFPLVPIVTRLTHY